MRLKVGSLVRVKQIFYDNSSDNDKYSALMGKIGTLIEDDNPDGIEDNYPYTVRINDRDYIFRAEELEDAKFYQDLDEILR